MTESAAPSRFLTVSQVAAELGLSRRTVERKIAAGDIPTFKLGDGPKAPVRIQRVELEAWLYRPFHPDGDAA